MPTTLYRYIVEESGDAFIEGTRISVAEIAVTLEFGARVNESDIERIVKLYPEGYLSPAKIYSALAYFYDNREIVMRTIRDKPDSYFVRDGKGVWVHRK